MLQLHQILRGDASQKSVYPGLGFLVSYKPGKQLAGCHQDSRQSHPRCHPGGGGGGESWEKAFPPTSTSIWIDHQQQSSLTVQSLTRAGFASADDSVSVSAGEGQSIPRRDPDRQAHEGTATRRSSVQQARSLEKFIYRHTCLHELALLPVTPLTMISRRNISRTSAPSAGSLIDIALGDIPVLVYTCIRLSCSSQCSTITALMLCEDRS